MCEEEEYFIGKMEDQYNEELMNTTEISEQPTDAPPPESQALQVSNKFDMPAVREITPQQARNESIATTLDAAYQRASTLQLTPEESQALAADFPDEAFRLGAGGDDNLLYLEHAYLRKRLNDVLGVGAATPIRRREWAEEFTYFKDRQEKKGVRVYVDLVLIVRGCVVGEAIGDAVYYPDNAKQNYSDALESAKSNAFRRAAKEFGVGLQPWMKGFCEAWKQRNRGGNAHNHPRNSNYSAQPPSPRPQPASAPKTAPEANPGTFREPPAGWVNPGQQRTAATPASVLPATATPKTREWAWNQLVALFGPDVVWDFLVSRKWVNPESNDYTTWNLEHVPTSKQALTALAGEIGKTQAPQESATTKMSKTVDTDLPEEIANAVITVPRRGMKRADYLQNPDTIGSLYTAMKDGDQEAQKRLWGLVRGWTPEPYVDASGKKWPVKQEDAQCRIDLDTFADWHEQNHGNGGE